MSIKFKLPIVDDSLVYEDENNKSLGYTIKSGVDISATEVLEISLGGRGKKVVI